jgi:hypothetical protein
VGRHGLEKTNESIGREGDTRGLVHYDQKSRGIASFATATSTTTSGSSEFRAR